MRSRGGGSELQASAVAQQRATRCATCPRTSVGAVTDTGISGFRAYISLALLVAGTALHT